MFQCDNGSDYVSEGMYRIVDQRGRIGYADESGKTVIKPRFAFGFPFKNGKAKVTEQGTMKEVPGSGGEYHYWNSDEWYYINKKGKRMYPSHLPHSFISKRGCVIIDYGHLWCTLLLYIV